MKIWYINNYNMLPEHGALNRGYYIGKYLKRIGEEPVVFVGSHPHNTNLQLIEGSEPFRVYQDNPFPWVLIKTRNYEGSKKSRVLSMFEFYRNMKKAAKHFDKPDAIIGSSAHPLAALLAIRLGKKYGCKSLIEVRDLWPESIVAYGVLPRNNPLVLLLQKLEKWLYVHADGIVFLMEGAYEYIREQGWEKDIPRSKVSYISNGVDIELFDYNTKNNTISDEDLDEEDTIKVVYTGSLRKANEQIKPLFDAIQLMQSPKYSKYRFLIYGKGELQVELEKMCVERALKNVRIKGYVEKKYIPYILSKCNIAVLNCVSHEILKYGGSQNKLFDYLASGISIISGEDNKYSIVKNRRCGISENYQTSQELVDALVKLSEHPIDKDYIRSIAENYDYKKIAQKLLDAIENC